MALTTPYVRQGPRIIECLALVRPRGRETTIENYLQKEKNYILST